MKQCGLLLAWELGWVFCVPHNCPCGEQVDAKGLHAMVCKKADADQIHLGGGMHSASAIVVTVMKLRCTSHKLTTSQWSLASCVLSSLINIMYVTLSLLQCWISYSHRVNGPWYSLLEWCDGSTAWKSFGVQAITMPGYCCYKLTDVRDCRRPRYVAAIEMWRPSWHS